METLLIIIIIEVVILTALWFLLRKHPCLGAPFDRHYNEFKRAYRKYQSVLRGQKTYPRFATDLQTHYKYIIDKTIDVSCEKYKTASTLLDMIETKQNLIQKYFSQKLTYSKYSEMLKEYNLTDEEKKFQSKTYAVPLIRKIFIFESLFGAAEINVDNTQKARFIRNLLEIELETDKIANTNIYKQLKKTKNAPETKKERLSRAEDLKYVVNELEYIGLQKEKSKLINEIEEYKDSVL